MPKQAFYAVQRGRVNGVYLTWSDCEAQVKNFPGAIYQKFPTAAQAESFVNLQSSKQPAPPEAAPGPPRGHKRPLVDSIDDSEWTVVYSDGACKGNGKVGSIAGIGVFWGPDDPRNIAERCPGEQTNNRAELIAIVRVLETAPVSKKKLLIKTDSQYSINCFKQWLPKWRQNGFLTSTGTPVKNAGVIRYLSSLLNERSKRGQVVQLDYVKGHSGDPGNDGADAQANIGATLPSRPESDWEELQAHCAQKTEVLLVEDRERCHEVESLVGPSSSNRPNKAVKNTPALASSVSGLYHTTPTSVQGKELLSTTSFLLQTSRSPFRPAISSRLQKPAVYQKDSQHPPQTSAQTLEGSPITDDKTVSPEIARQSSEVHRSSPRSQTPPKAETPKHSIFLRSPLKVALISPPLIPVETKEVNLDLYKDCLLEGEDWAEEIANL